MDASQQPRLEEVETKTNMLENVLAQFISSMNEMVLRLEADTRRFKEEVRSDTKKLKDEMKDFKDEMNKKWGELSNKMGTLVEDIVAPNIRGIARDYFHDDDFETFNVRVLKRSRRDRTIRREFDVIGETDETFYINETKSKPRPEDVSSFLELLETIPDFFPGSSGKRMIPIFSSLYIPENIQTRLTKRGIYALAMKEGTMDLLNFREVAGSEITPSNSTG